MVPAQEIRRLPERSGYRLFSTVWFMTDGGYYRFLRIRGRGQTLTITRYAKTYEYEGQRHGSGKGEIIGQIPCESDRRFQALTNDPAMALAMVRERR